MSSNLILEVREEEEGRWNEFQSHIGSKGRRGKKMSYNIILEVREEQ